jgi:hypothetical protein
MTQGTPHIQLPASRIAAMLAVTLAVFTDIDPASSEPTPSCRVTNVTTQQVYVGSGTNLQIAIDEAARGTTLRVKGLCVGTFTIAKGLKLRGVPTSAVPTPTLDGNSVGSVLTVDAGHVVLTDLTITNGNADVGTGIGAGILNAGALVLTGSSSVSGNDAGTGGGGGIYNEGSLALFDSSSVSMNGAGRGAGIYNVGSATTHLHDASSVSSNSAAFAGGGIYNLGVVRLDDQSHVSENLNSEPDYVDGGGIYNLGVVSLNDSSSVWGNRAGEDGCGGCGGSSGGGGIYNEGTLTMRNWASVRGNTTFSETRGGGIVNVGQIRMHGASSVRHNTATDANGGGILNGGTITMNGRSSVRWNTALNGQGGGIFGSGTLIGVVEGGNVSNNLPDDIAP